MEFQNAIQLIEKSEYVGILLPREPDFDCLASAEVIMHALEEEGKIAGMLNSDLPLGENGSPFSKIKSSPSLPRDFVISLASGNTDISQLRYEKTENALDIVISPKKNSLKEELVSFREGKIRCDAAIALGIQDIDSQSARLAVHPEFFTETPILNIDTSQENKKFGEVNLIAQDRAALAEIIYDFLSQWREKPLLAEQATLVLAAIYSKTKTLRSPSVRPDTVLAASELLRIGAQHLRAQDLAKENQPLSLLQLYGRAAVRTRLDERQKVLWSFLTAEDFAKTGRGSQDNFLVLDMLRESFPSHRIGILLSQESGAENVLATVLGDDSALSRITQLAQAEFQSPHLRLKESFRTFKEAEEYLSSLLLHALA